MARKKLLSVLAVGAVFAALAGLHVAEASAAAPYGVLNGHARCWLGGTTIDVTAPSMTEYGIGATKDYVRRWVRLVDLYGNPTSVWINTGTGLASQTSPVNFGTATISRPSSDGYGSRIESYIQWFQNGVVAFTSDTILTQYDVYFSTGISSRFAGVESYC